MTDERKPGPKFIEMPTDYGFGKNKPPIEKLDPTKRLPPEATNTELLRKVDELAKLRQQMESVGTKDADVDTDPAVAGFTPAERAKYHELIDEISRARTEVEQNPVADRNDPEQRNDFQALVKKVTEAETQLANLLKNRGTGNVGQSAESEDRELNEGLKGKKGLLAKLLDKLIR